MKLSIVTTLFKSAAYVAGFHERATRAAAAMTPDYEILFVNDGSPDDAAERAIALHQRDRHVRVLDLSRNFGHHRAMMTGLEHARGDLVFLLDVDLEEQPEWLGQFEQVMRETGADVVYGVQSRRKGGAFERLSGAIFYRGFNALLDHPIPENAVTARLMTRRYVNSLVQHRDRAMTMAPLWAMTGYRQVAVAVEKKSRGETSYSIRRRISALVDNLTSFSNRPLVYIFYLGSFIMVVSAGAAAVLIWRAEHGEVGVPGWPTLIVSIWFLGGIMIFCLGVIGVYLSKIFIETKDRPYAIVRADHDHQGASERARLAEAAGGGEGRMSTTVVGQVARYYASKLAAHGPTPRGVDWNTEQSQMVRFEQFMGLMDAPEATVCDYGCGYGAFLDFLRARGHAGAYVGFDAAAEMIESARALHSGDPRATFASSRAGLEVCDYTVASGIFNVRLTTPVPEWQQYMEATIDDLALLSRRGFAFNALTSYSDADKQRADLYYADPRQVLDHCLRRWPRRVALLHDYGLYQFTIRVRL